MKRRPDPPEIVCGDAEAFATFTIVRPAAVTTLKDPTVSSLRTMISVPFGYFDAEGKLIVQPP